MNKDDNDNNLMAAFGTAASIGALMVSSLVAGLFLGKLTDKYLHISPWGTVVGIVLGMISGMWATYKKLVRGKGL